MSTTTTKIFFFIIINFLVSNKILIPMDQTQTDHLKAYGISYSSLKKGVKVDWLINYRGGSFMLDASESIKSKCLIRGVYYEIVNGNDLAEIFSIIESNNMDILVLDTPAKIAVYSPPGKQPWDDAVTLALTYAEVEYDVIFDDEILSGDLSKYDWLHLHHEDFTGQYGKFYKNYNKRAWYKQMESDFNFTANKYGFSSVHNLKKDIAFKIKQYMSNGGFVFAMCSATDSFDIALSALNVDIAHQVFDGTGIDPNYNTKLNYHNCVAFENFELYTDPMIYEYSTIDLPPGHKPVAKGAEEDYFTLFEFSAKWDPVPTMLTQNHVGVINGFMGQTTSFNRENILFGYR